MQSQRRLWNVSPVRQILCILTRGILSEPSSFKRATCSCPVKACLYPTRRKVPNAVGILTSASLTISLSVLSLYAISWATVINFRLCLSANFLKSSLLAIEPSGFTISQHTAASLRPANLHKSTAASVCPTLSSTPPFFAISGNMCPGCLKSTGFVKSSAISFKVIERSIADTPVVTPYLGSASTLCVKAVPFTSVLSFTIKSRPSFFALSSLIGAQSTPLASVIIKFTFSVVANSAAQIKSPSFSLDSSSATIIIPPFFMLSIASSTLSKRKEASFVKTSFIFSSNDIIKGTRFFLTNPYLRMYFCW